MAKDAMTFEESMQQLEEIVRQLEQGNVPLEQAIDLYKRGMTLSKSCHDTLQHAEQQLITIVDRNGNEMTLDQVKGE
ncbi:exodeoxyribonuclease VII small subunit [Caryophanon tenue]|uniref:Exodeoxyribonuclease 7 small subunit n=1 Tax=Caryophanon tenue TaxID=33978 RepID=A0A1C0YN86_9BACL|nr:exodeoxyribonuclease VII small subunit [Caryophanon tenue]OCS88622.1 exodeoxyribonuclease VII small subunit [Caryophanon tenue]